VVVVAAIVGVAIVGSVAFAMSGGSSPSAPRSSPAETAKQLAQDRTAQADLRNALVAARVTFVDHGSYAAATAVRLGGVEPTLCFVGAHTPSVASGAECRSGHGAASVSVFTSRQVWSAARRSASGTCFWIKDDVTSGTTYGSGLPCTGAAAGAASASRFPGASAVAPAASGARCVDMAKVVHFSQAGSKAERQAIASVSLSDKATFVLRAAISWRAAAHAMAAYPRVARPTLAAAAAFGASARALGRGEPARADALFRRAERLIRRASKVIDAMPAPPAC
jgi:hypothetical protein